MRRWQVRAVSLALVTGLALESHAVASSMEGDLCSFSLNKPKLFFSNGVGNTLGNAHTSASEALIALAADGVTNSLIVATAYGVLYHHDDGLPQDVAETLLQKARDETRNPDVVWDNIVALSRGLSAPGILLTEMLAAVTSFNFEQLKRKALAQVEAESYADAGQLSDFLAANPKARALVVGHSQGTLYANGVYDHIARNALPEMAKRVRVVNVGAAASKVSGQADPSSPEQYVTSYVDGVILGLRGISAAAGLAAPLPANVGAHFVTSAPGAAGILGFNVDAIQNHGFVSTYLYDATSRYPLRTLLRNVLLEWVDVDTASFGGRVEVEMVVNAPRGSTCPAVNDSTSISGASPIGPQKGAYFLVNSGACLQQQPGSKVYIATIRDFANCSYKTALNFRPDSLGSALTLRPAVGAFSMSVRRKADEPAYVSSLRYRFSYSDGREPSSWSPVDLTGTALTDEFTVIPVFSYSSSLHPGGLRLTIQ